MHRTSVQYWISEKHEVYIDIKWYSTNNRLSLPHLSVKIPLRLILDGSEVMIGVGGIGLTILYHSNKQYIKSLFSADKLFCCWLQSSIPQCGSMLLLYLIYSLCYCYYRQMYSLSVNQIYCVLSYVCIQ